MFCPRRPFILHDSGQNLLVNGQLEAYLLSLKAETTVWVSTTGVFTGDAGGAGDPRKLKENNKHQGGN